MNDLTKSKAITLLRNAFPNCTVSMEKKTTLDFHNIGDGGYYTETLRVQWSVFVHTKSEVLLEQAETLRGAVNQML